MCEARQPRTDSPLSQWGVPFAGSGCWWQRDRGTRAAATFRSSEPRFRGRAWSSVLLWSLRVMRLGGYVLAKGGVRIHSFHMHARVSRTPENKMSETLAFAAQARSATAVPPRIETALFGDWHAVGRVGRGYTLAWFSDFSAA